MRRFTGVTLVETLIIVTILGILAVLIIPHLAKPREQLLAEEAQELLRILRLSQINVRARSGRSAWTPARSYRMGEPFNEGWNVLAMKPLPDDAPFDYACHPDLGTCRARRLSTPLGPKAGGVITIDLESGTFSCEAPYAVIGDTHGSAVCG